MLHFNFNSTEPIYLQVANQLEEAIFTKAFLDGTQVPSTTEISKEFHINPATVLKGMNILVRNVCNRGCLYEVTRKKERVFLPRLYCKNDTRS